jgi:hypothetical protein
MRCVGLFGLLVALDDQGAGLVVTSTGAIS